MIFLLHRTPAEPPEFGADLKHDHPGYARQSKLKAAAGKVQDLIKEAKKLDSEQFAPLWKEYKAHFKDAQYGKCCFCDQKIAATQYGNVEHFRPKTEVSDFPSASGKKRGTKRLIHKPGYWWLAYTWSNWLYACELCNKTYKGSQFPVVERLALIPGVTSQERPLLIQPYLEDPSKHLRYRETGEIEHCTSMGEASIRVYGLDREELIEERSSKAALVMRQLGDLKSYILDMYEPAISNCVRELKLLKADKEAFAGMCQSLLDNDELWQEVESLYP